MKYNFITNIQYSSYNSNVITITHKTLDRHRQAVTKNFFHQ